MDLELSNDQLALRDNIRTVLEGACPPDAVRAVYEGSGDSRALWEQVADLGWPGLSVPESAGGLGLGFVEVALLAEDLGRATAPGPLLATASQLTPALVEAKAHSELEEVASGRRTGALAVSECGRWRPDQPQTAAAPTADGWGVSGAKTDVCSGTEVSSFVVWAAHDRTGAPGLFLVEAGDAEARPKPSIEPTLALTDVEFDEAPATALVEPGDGSSDAVERVLQHAVVAMAMQTVGACRRIFEVTLEYAKVREQYGRPIGSFQAVKHRLADLFLAVERATAVCYYASLCIAEDSEGRAAAAHSSKIAAGDCQRLLARDGLQLHGGIGFTWENDLHFLLKRAKAGELLCGSSRFHRGELAAILGLADKGES
ncbi:MAG: acyl-CoA/acyl-ACP dehydrogenase [bacterium]|nr:acyl-CoA/acyl-ACP dehydrogenase [bacterium]